MLANVSFAHNLYSTSNSSLSVDTLSYFTKRAFAEDTSNLILLVEALRLFETLEHAELEYLLGP